jgi:hypothetical protein
MGNEVYANGMELACKAGEGKSVCAFPDVCFTPPQTPATPPGVPIPYPNTGMASDTTDGTKNVKITGKEVMLKNKSYFKKSTGDEAGCAPKKGVVTSKIQGKVYFTAWSMDVKFEGENVVRHFDMTTHNHASSPGNTIPWLFVDGMDVSQVPEGCKKEAKEFNKHCGKHVKPRKGGAPGEMNLQGTNDAMCDDPKCKKARKCILTPKNMGCCDGKTGHHVIPDSQFTDDNGKRNPKYSYDDAPCICVTGNSHHVKNHGKIHTKLNNLTVNHPSVSPKVVGKTIQPGASWKVSDAADAGAQAASEVTKCKKECIEAQTLKGHDNMGIKPNNNIKPTTAGKVTKPPPAQGVP